MAPHVSANLQKIKKATKTLNELADKATEHIRALDVFFTENNPAVNVYGSEIGRETGTNSKGHKVETTFDIGYGKDDAGKWGIVVRVHAEETTSNGKIVTDEQGCSSWGVLTVVRLSAAARELRVASLPKLPELLESLADVIEKSVKKATESLKEVEAVSEELGSSLKK